MPRKTPNIGLNKFAYGESLISDHPEPAKRQAPDDTLNHNADVLDVTIADILARLEVVEDLLRSR